MCAAYGQLQSLAKTGGEIREDKAEIKGEGLICMYLRLLN